MSLHFSQAKRREESRRGRHTSACATVPNTPCRTASRRIHPVCRVGNQTGVLSGILRKIVPKQGLAAQKKAGVTGRWHDGRHTLITDLAESGLLMRPSAIAGYVSKQMLKHYSHIRMAAKPKPQEPGTAGPDGRDQVVECIQPVSRRCGEKSASAA